MTKLVEVLPAASSAEEVVAVLRRDGACVVSDRLPLVMNRARQADRKQLEADGAALGLMRNAVRHVRHFCFFEIVINHRTIEKIDNLFSQENQ